MDLPAILYIAAVTVGISAGVIVYACDRRAQRAYDERVAAEHASDETPCGYEAAWFTSPPSRAEGR